MATESIFEEACRAMIGIDAAKAVEVAKRGLAEGVDPAELLHQGFIPGITQVGELFEKGKLFLPELIQAADAMQKAVNVLNTAMPESSGNNAASVLIGTVEGDIHDIGKTIVVSLFKANGFKVFDLGRDVSIERFIEEAQKNNVDIIGTSALLTTTMGEQQRLEEALQEAGLKGKIKTMIGGAPVTQSWADSIGADAYAENAAEAVSKARELLGMT
jgi:trimethylamine corrinoid protein